MSLVRKLRDRLQGATLHDLWVETRWVLHHSKRYRRSIAAYVLLDEVTSALDLETEQRVLENIAALPGKTCILSTHRPSVLSLCSRVYRLHNAALELLPESEWRRLYRNN